LIVLSDSLFHEPIIEAQGGGSNGLSTHIVATLAGFSGGFTSGIFIGFAIALTMSQFKALSLLLEPALEFFRALPPLLVVPFAILLCRSNDTLECFTVAIYSAFSICVYTLSAARNIVPNYTHLAKLLGAGRLRRVFDVQIPAIMPELVGALRVTAALSLGIVVVVEYLAAPSGIGRVMKFAISYSRVDLIVVSVIWSIIIAIGVDSTISMLFRLVLRWARREQVRAF
jgi:NitT/TauT family transport system permease protein